MQQSNEIYSFKSQKKNFSLKIMENDLKYDLELDGDAQSVLYFITNPPQIFNITGPTTVTLDKDEVLLENKHLFIYSIVNESRAKHFLRAAPIKSIYRKHQHQYYFKTYNDDHGAIIVGFFKSTSNYGTSRGSYGIANVSNVPLTYVIDDGITDVIYYYIRPDEAVHIYNTEYDSSSVKIRTDDFRPGVASGIVNCDDQTILRNLSYNNMSPCERRNYVPMSVADGIMSCLDSKFTNMDWIKNTECIYSGSLELDDDNDKHFYIVNSHGVRYPYHYKEYKTFIPFIKSNGMVCGNFIYKMYGRGRSIKYNLYPHSQSSNILRICYSDSSDDETI